MYADKHGVVFLSAFPKVRGLEVKSLFGKAIAIVDVMYNIGDIKAICTSGIEVQSL